MDESEASLEVVLTNHALGRLNERFFLRSSAKMESVFERAVVEGPHVFRRGWG